MPDHTTDDSAPNNADNDTNKPLKPKRSRKKGFYKDVPIVDIPDPGLEEQKRLQAERDRKQYLKDHPAPKLPKINPHTGTTLNLKESRFVSEFTKDLKIGAAAKRAGYSPDSASTTGGILLKRKDIQMAVKKEEMALAERNHVSQDRIIGELCTIAFLDIRELFTKRGKLKPIHLMPEHVTRALAGIDISQKFTRRIKGDGTEEGGSGKLEYEKITKVKVRDKMKALELLGRHIGMFGEGDTDRLPDLASLLLEARHRINEVEKARREGAIDADYTVMNGKEEEQEQHGGDRSAQDAQTEQKT